MVSRADTMDGDYDIEIFVRRESCALRCRTKRSSLTICMENVESWWKDYLMEVRVGG